MKKVLLTSFCAITFLVIFCGCSKEKGDDMPMANTDAGYLPARNTKLTYKIMTGDGKGESFVQQVGNFKDSSGYRVATISMEMPGIEKQSYTAFYNSERTVVQNAIPSSYYQMMQQMKLQFTTSFTHKEVPLITDIPHKNPSGVTAAPETVVASWHGTHVDGIDKFEGEFSLTHHETKVAGEEKIATEAGSFDCVKLQRQITVLTKYTSNGSVIANNKSVSTLSTWLAKGVGVVKTREESDDGISETDLVRIQ